MKRNILIITTIILFAANFYAYFTYKSKIPSNVQKQFEKDSLIQENGIRNSLKRLTLSLTEKKDSEKIVKLINTDEETYYSPVLNFNRGMIGYAIDKDKELSKYYEESKENKNSFKVHKSWDLGVIELWLTHIPLGYVSYNIYPHGVGYFKNSSNRPSIDEALINALKFYTEDKESEYSKYPLKSEISTFLDFKNGNINFNFPLYKFEEGDGESVDVDGVYPYGMWYYDNNNKVYLRSNNVRFFLLEINKEAKNTYIKAHTTESKNRSFSIFIIINVVLSIALIVQIYCSIKGIVKGKRNILDRIKTAANPKQYLKNYNKEILDIANEIYESSQNTSLEDEEAILELADKVEDKLKVHLVTKEEQKKLVKLCNPKHFMKPYNAEKIKEANEFYSLAKSKKLSYSVYVKISKEIKELYLK